MAKKKSRKKAATPSPNLLQPPKNGAAIRMYCHGLGDCFLLAFDKGGTSSRPCYVLVDCGVHNRQDKGSKRLGEVMTNLITATGGKIDVVVATHEHADHLSGFVQKGSPFIDGRLQVDLFWTAWTENREDSQANRLRDKRAAARETIRKAVEKVRKRGVTGFAEQLTGLLDFEDLEDDVPVLGAQAKKKASSNEVALEMLGQNATVVYCEPGETLMLPGVRSGRARAYVLAPPRDEDLLKRDRPKEGPGQETYLTGRARQRTFLQAPAFCPSECADPREADLRHPFESVLRRKCRFDVKGDAARWKGADGPPETRSFCQKHYFSDDDWRRIDTDWLDTAEQLALHLNNDTNNTSLVLAFELGPVQEGPVFLFAGDAQVGNWLSWRSQDYKAGRRTFSVDGLLARTALYKVGHHGSHNATIRRDPLHKSAEHPQGEPFGLELMPSRLIALIPVDQEAVRKPMPKPWHMPHPPLYARLLERAAGRVLRSDGLLPTADGLHVQAHAPTGHTQTRPPGLANVTWCEAPVKFKTGRRCPLYYDLMFEP